MDTAGSADTADVLVVGGGSAGCVVAARLSEDPARRVLLVEAGPQHGASRRVRDASIIPALDRRTWRYTTALTDPTPRRPGRDAELYRGRALGGSGVINGGYFARATAADVDAWPGLDFDTLLASFVRSETDADFGDAPGHGRSGPVPVRRQQALHPLSEQMWVAACDAGLGEVDDLNGVGAGDGVARLPLNVHDGVRLDTASAYLPSVLGRTNLRVRSAVVTRVLISGARATGVELAGGGRLRAGHVVLCAGAIESAHLLLLSGVGPAAELRALGVGVHADLPVGRGFSDHPDVAVPNAHADPNEHADPNGHAEHTGVRGTPPLEVVVTTPTVELRPYTAGFARLVPGSGAGPGPCVGVALRAPDSRGTLTLTSTDPGRAPVLAHHHLAPGTDRAHLADGVRFTHELLGQHPPDDVDAWIAAHLGTSQHLVGTCALGPVVDERFSVHGVGCLSVVDAAVIPVVPSRGPHATVVAVAEHAAQVLGLPAPVR